MSKSTDPQTTTISLEARNATDAIDAFMKSNPNTWKAGAEIIIQTALDCRKPTEQQLSNVEYMVRMMFEKMFPCAKQYREFQENETKGIEHPRNQ